MYDGDLVVYDELKNNFQIKLTLVVSFRAEQQSSNKKHLFIRSLEDINEY